MMKRKKKVITTSVTKQPTRPYFPGLRSPYPFAAKPPGIQPGWLEAISHKTAAAAMAPATCAMMYRTPSPVAQRPALHRPIVTAGLKWPPEI